VLTICCHLGCHFRPAPDVRVCCVWVNDPGDQALPYDSPAGTGGVSCLQRAASAVYCRLQLYFVISAFSPPWLPEHSEAPRPAFSHTPAYRFCHHSGAASAFPTRSTASVTSTRPVDFFIVTSTTFNASHCQNTFSSNYCFISRQLRLGGELPRNLDLQPPGRQLPSRGNVHIAPHNKLGRTWVPYVCVSFNWLGGASGSPRPFSLPASSVMFLGTSEHKAPEMHVAN
jgi:hypothetical protein